MTETSGRTAALQTGRKQQVVRALEILIGAVNREVGRPSRGIASTTGVGLVTGEAALLLRASGGLVADPGVGGARDRLAAVAGQALGADLIAPVLVDHESGDGLVVDGVALDWLHEAVAGPAGAARDRGVGIELERAWIRGVWGDDFSGLDDERLLSRSALGRPVDTFATGTEDVYALTRAVLVATDVGHRPTSATVTVGEAEAALALALDADDLGLVAEVLWLWPLLDLPWTAPADFALRLVDDQGTPGASAHRAALSYGVLNALLAKAKLRQAPRSADEPVVALPAPGHGPRWAAAYRALPLQRRSALAPVVLTVVVNRAHHAHDLAALRTAVKVAFAHGLLDSPAASQAAVALRRSDPRAVVHALAG